MGKDGIDFDLDKDNIEDITEAELLDEDKDIEAVRKIETIAGLVILVILIIIAAWLILRKNNKHVVDKQVEPVVTEQITDDSKTQDTEDAVAEGEATDTDNLVVDLTTVAQNDGKTTEENKISKAELPQQYTAGNMREYTFNDSQMIELYAYWDEYSLDAVNELIRLDRMKKVTDSLKGTNDYYYCGATNASGLPDGKGLAIYADNTYYFGDWKNGKRDGGGMWLRIFPDEYGVVNGVNYVTAHSYNGNWANDYPNGDGQEHFDYDRDQDINADMIILNVIGKFKNGMYDGETLVMMLYGGNEVDWMGNLKSGTFEYIGDIRQKAPDDRRAIMQADRADDYFYLSPKKNKGFGIAGLK